jgi:TonB family protein
MNYLEYQLKVGLTLFILYFIYRVFIATSNRFRYKRIFIVSSLLAGFVVPFIEINIENTSGLVQYVVLPEVVVSIVANSSKESSILNVQNGLTIALVLISVIMLISFIREVYRIVRLISDSEKKISGSFILVKTLRQEAFSFFHYVFLGKLIPDDKKAIILEHELVHVRKMHTIDNIIINLFIVMQWFNPVVWLFRKSLQENHEFEADYFMLANGALVEEYQHLLLNQIFQTKNINFSSFNHNSFIKNRIKMMTKFNQKSGKTRFLLAAIMSIFVLSVFSFQAEITQMSDKVKSISISPNPVKDTTKILKKEVAYLLVDQPATFRGNGLEAFNKYVLENVTYPKEAVQKKMQGKVYVQFVVETDGTVKDAKVLRGVGLILDEEAVRVVKSSPAWTPAKKDGRNVRQMFTLPVEFALQ